MLPPEPMLASTLPGAPEQVLARLAQDGRWVTEIKFDGIRAFVHRDATGTVTITNRRQAFISHRYPELVETIRAMPFVGTLDGEIIVLDPDGRPSFARAHRRDAQSTPSTIRRLAAQLPATFVPFDMLDVAGADIRGRGYLTRRQSMTDAWGAGVSLADADGQTMWRFVQEQNLEGLVAKRVDAPYVGRRSPHWVKIKATRRISALVTGLAADGRGALELALWDGQARELRSVGRVGSGLRAVDLQAIRARLAAGTPTVVEVEYLDASGGQLRQPVFRGLRTDVSAQECTVQTLR